MLTDPQDARCRHTTIVTWGAPESRMWACASCSRRMYPACVECVNVGHRNETHVPAAPAPASGEGLRVFEAPFDNPWWSEELEAIRARSAADDPGSDRANLLRAYDAEMQDAAMLGRHLSAIYDDITGGAVSKPNTLPSVVIALYQERTARDIEEAVAEALAAATQPDERLEALRKSLAEYDEEMDDPYGGGYEQAAKAAGPIIEAVRALLAASPEEESRE